MTRVNDAMGKWFSGSDARAYPTLAGRSGSAVAMARLANSTARAKSPRKPYMDASSTSVAQASPEHADEAVGVSLTSGAAEQLSQGLNWFRDEIRVADGRGEAFPTPSVVYGATCTGRM